MSIEKLNFIDHLPEVGHPIRRRAQEYRNRFERYNEALASLQQSLAELDKEVDTFIEGLQGDDGLYQWTATEIYQARLISNAMQSEKCVVELQSKNL